MEHYEGVQLSDRPFVAPGTTPHREFVTDPMRNLMRKQKEYPVRSMEKYLKEDKKI